jgi:hypothetical protein
MAWESRKNGRSYYTRSVRINGRVTREYIGAGPVAEAIAGLDYHDRLARTDAQQKARADRVELDRMEALAVKYGAEVSTAVATALTEAGYHRHERGNWRRKRNIMKPKPTNEAPTAIAIPNAEASRSDAIIASIKAPAGSKAEALAIECINQNRKDQRIARYDNFIGPLLDLRAGKDRKVGREIVQFAFDRECADVAGPNATPLENLLAERVVVNKHYLAMYESMLMKKMQDGGMSLPLATFHEKRISMAQNRYLAAIKAMAQIRKLQLPPNIQVNIGEKQVNIATTPV